MAGKSHKKLGTSRIVKKTTLVKGKEVTRKLGPKGLQQEQKRHEERAQALLAGEY